MKKYLQITCITQSVATSIKQCHL